MNKNRVVSEDEWLKARQDLLVKEKELTKLEDKVTAARQELPWVKVDKDYSFESPEGTLSLSDLFGNQSQLIVYHFMFDPSWDEGCKSCSMIADHYDPIGIHLKARDVNLVTVSRTPMDKIQAFKVRMGWTFPWVSSYDSDFNYDFNVSFTPEQIEAGETIYNYRSDKPFPMEEAPGMSCFYKDDDGTIYHTYSVYSRGLENYLGVYDFLNTVTKGRDERALEYGMEWVRHKDRYEDSSFVDPYVQIASKF